MPGKPSYVAILAGLALIGAGAGVLIGTLSSRAGQPPRAPAAPGTAAPTRDVGGTEAPATEADNPYSRFGVADFALTDQDGRPVTQAVFDGEVTVLTFFFASCPDPCPAIQRVMSDVQARTAGTRVRLASISVDGVHDTPDRIRDYAQGFGADFDRWTFMTGEPETVAALVRDSISFTIRGREELTITRPDGTKIAQILHPTRLILVGPDRRVIGLYAYNDPDAVDRLVADARAAAG